MIDAIFSYIICVVIYSVYSYIKKRCLKDVRMDDIFSNS